LQNYLKTTKNSNAFVLCLASRLKNHLPTIMGPCLRFPTDSIYNASVICLFQVFTTATLEDMIFSVAGPTIWKSPPDYLCEPAVDLENFRQNFETYLFTGHYGLLAH